jgi:hypothetical protein
MGVGKYYRFCVGGGGQGGRGATLYSNIYNTGSKYIKYYVIIFNIGNNK